MSLAIATLRRMPRPDPALHPLAADPADELFAPQPDGPDQGATALADLLAGLLGLFIAVFGLLIACGWLTTLWGAVLLAALLFCPLILVMAVLLRP